MKHFQKYWLLYLLLIIIVVAIAMNWEKIFGGAKIDSTGNGGDTNLPASKTRSVGENMAVEKAKAELNSLGIDSESNAQVRPADVQRIVNNLNTSFSNIGSDLRAYSSVDNPVGLAGKSCNALCQNRNCTGAWGSGIFGFCICFGCGGNL